MLHLCTGIYKADIGLRGGLIAGIGKAGNPDVMHGVSTGMIIGVNTEVLLFTPLLTPQAPSEYCALLQYVTVYLCKAHPCTLCTDCTSSCWLIPLDGITVSRRRMQQSTFCSKLTLYPTSTNTCVTIMLQVISGEGLIVTAGGMDAHVHYICPQIAQEVCTECTEHSR
jgi:Urease alpha-subunit, N-terminal domain